MSVKVPLSVRGLDLRDAATYDRLGELTELDWKAVGPITLAVVYVEHGNAVGEAVDWARRILKTLDGVSVGVYDELVSVSDIALRCGMSAESVRLWAAGKRRGARLPFPPPRQVVSVGERSMSLYAWRDVVAWVREVVQIDPDEGITYLDDMQVAQLVLEVAEFDSGWQPVLGVVREITTQIHGELPEPVMTTDVREPIAAPTRLVG
jgi:hypothetical protein